MLTANSIQAEFEDFDPMGRFKCVIYGEAQSSVKCSNKEDCCRNLRNYLAVKLQ